jgi:hypothetical protein
MSRSFWLSLATTVLAPCAALADWIAIGGAAATSGVGGTVAVRLTDRFNVRGEYLRFPVQPRFESSGISYAIHMANAGRAVLDFYPVHWFHLSGGALFGGAVELSETYDSPEPVEIGGKTYAGTGIGSLHGALDFGGVAPYAGIGFGNPIGKALGIAFDFGVAFSGAPDVSLRASGPLAHDSGFRAELASEQAEVQSKLDVVTVYPVASLRLSMSF